MGIRSAKNLAYIAGVVAAMLGLWFTSRHSYLLFHSLAELTSIGIAGAMFSVAWNSRRFSANDYLSYLGIAFLSVACLDLMHTLAYKGLGVFAGYGADMPTQLWIAGRGLEAFSLLISPVFLFRRVRPWPTLLVYLAAVAALLVLIFPLNAFPSCYVEGGLHPGLTPFKIGAEYVICACLLAGMGILWASHRRLSPNVFVLIMLAMSSTILSELAFTRYVSVYGDFNMIGHLLKVAAFLLFYKATVEASLKDPYHALFRDLSQREAALRAGEERYRTTVESIGDGVITTDAEGRITLMNAVAEELTGWTLVEASMKPVTEVFNIMNEQTRKTVEDPVAKVLREGMIVGLANHTVLVKKDGTEVPIDDSGAPIRDNDGNTMGVVLVFRDITGRRRDEAMLRESKARLDLALDSAEMGAWHWDIPEDKRYFDDQVCRLLGIEPTTFRGSAKEFFDVVHPDDRERLHEALSRTIEQDLLYEPEYRAVWPDGTIHHIAARGRLVRDDAGRPVRINGIIWDITERKHAEEAVQTTLRRFYTVLSSMHTSVVLATDDGRVEFVNQPFCDYFGFSESPGDFVGLPSADLIAKMANTYLHPEEAAARLREIIEQGQPVSGEEVAMRNGRWHLRDFVPIRINGQSYGRLWYHTDITKRKQAEEEIRESRTKLEAALASMSDAVFISDAEGRFVEFNDAFATYHRFRDKEECYKTLAEYPDYIEVYFDDGTLAPLDMWAVARALRGETVSNAEYMLRRKDTGETWWGSYNFAPIKDKGGKIVGAVVVGREITERKRAEKELQDAHRLFADVIDGGPSPIFLKDREGRFITINAPLEKMLGMTREELKGKTDYDIASKDVADYWRSHDMEVMRAGQPLQIEEIADLKDGHHVFLASKFPLVDATGEIYGVGAISHDITDRKRQEARIVRLTQLYSMLSRVNEAIVRSRDQGELYEEVCRIIAKEGVFPLVWIGEVKDRQVAPTALCGPAADYLKEIRIEVDGVLGQGPTGTCIREDRPVVNDDFDTNPATLPWREPALRHGFRASACFPLHRHGKAIGVLTLYGAQPQSFDREQVELLQALAADVSYALDTFEQEKIRSRAETDLQKSLNRFELLAHTADELLQSPDPQKLVSSLCREVMEHLGCHAFFNFLAVEGMGRLRLNAYAGIPEEEARKIEWLDYGVAVCGCAAQDACRIVAGHIPTTAGPGTELVKSYGIKAYACHPLLVSEGKVIGTLSFGTCDRETFSDEDLSLMKAVADQVAVAMIRMKDEEAVKKARDELEERVEGRTAELQQAYDKLMRETEERQQIEAQLRQAQKMEALGTMSGGIAHDFNNMLAAIIGFAELLEGHVQKGSRDAHHLDRIMKAGIRGRELVRQMLTFSRKTEQEKKPLALSSIVKETVKLIRATTPSTINIRVNAVSEVLILGDPTQIQQVLMNLCTNAAHAMREKGGSLDIELSDYSASRSNDDPQGIAPGHYVKLTVRDTGIGMSSDVMEKIFDPFFTTKKVGEGTGLGLSVVHGIVKQHEGHIAVESEPGRGSTFTVYFPRITGGPKDDALRDDEIPTGTESILFVDDEEALVALGEDILAELGYEVTSRMNGMEALAIFRLDPSRFDLVITDQTMPDVTGADLAKEILAIRPDMPIIMCTGFSHLVDADRARAAGIKAFAMKPLTKREIARTIRRVLDE
jgi:PAS domain S-box-containing protein